MAILFKRGIVVLIIFILIIVMILGVKLLAKTFSVKNILISGNYHLEDEDIIKHVNIRKGENLLKLSFKTLAERLEHTPWIKKVSLRKQFPDTLLIRIEEAVPKALLSLNSSMFLIDKDGNILEEIKGEGTPFLPVIKNINPKNNSKGILEALKLIDVLAEKNILESKESIKIGLKSYGLTMNMDGEIIKIGYGRYSEKLDRWKELEPEIRKRGVAIKYIDLRFKDSVIVKPLINSKFKIQN
jgi:cell division protein FtsQ